MVFEGKGELSRKAFGIGEGLINKKREGLLEKLKGKAAQAGITLLGDRVEVTISSEMMLTSTRGSDKKKR